MPEPTDEELGIPEGLDPNIRAELRKGRLTAAERDEAQGQAKAAERELAFFKAGIPDTGIGELFRKGYDGPMDPESLKTAAGAYGIGEVNGAPNPEAERLAELERLRQIGAAGGGVPTPPPEAKAEFVKAMRAASSEEEAWAVIDRLGTAAGVRRLVQG